MALTKLKLFSDGLLIFGCFIYAPSRYFHLGLGYLGLPLAQKCYEQGSQVAAIKRTLTSDDINLPIELDIIDLNQDDIFHSSALWQNHINKPTWFCLLPPSSLNHYADTLKKWIQLAERCKVQHIIFTSSTSVYGDQARICDETTPPDPQTESAPSNPYSRASLA